jgi:hypothetical protein
MNVKSIASSSLADFKDDFLGLINDGFKPSLAIVFSDASMDNKAVAKTLETHNVEYIAGSSCGEIVGGKIYRNSITVSLFEIDQSKFKILKQNNQRESSLEAGAELAKVALESFENPAFISLLTLTVNGDTWLNGLRDELNYDPPIYAGIAAEPDLKPFLFTSDGTHSDSFHTIILDRDKIEIDGFAIAGWEAIGTEHEITKAENNIVYEINNEPALDFFNKFFGFYKDPLTTHISAHVNSQYPLQILRNKEKVMRAPMDADIEKKALVLAGPVEEGEKFRFSTAPGFSVIEDTITEFNKFKEGREQPDAMILFSCKARDWTFGPMVNDEVEALQKLWDIPYHGFFSYGEIGKNSKGKTQFFNTTCCLVTLKDK